MCIVSQLNAVGENAVDITLSRNLKSLMLFIHCGIKKESTNILSHLDSYVNKTYIFEDQLSKIIHICNFLVLDPTLWKIYYDQVLSPSLPVGLQLIGFEIKIKVKETIDKQYY